MERLRDCITARARLYRNLVVAVALGLSATVVAAAVLGSVRPLLGLLALPAVVLAHAARDAAAVHAWLADVIDDWAGQALQLDLLRAMVAKVPMLPAPTVAGMLDMLPAWPEAVPAGARHALATHQRQVNGLVRQTLWVRAGVGSLMLVVLFGAALAAHLVWLAAVPAAVAGALIWRSFAGHRLIASASACFDALCGHAGKAEAAAWLQATSVRGLPRHLLGRWQWHVQAINPAAGPNAPGTTG